MAAPSTNFCAAGSFANRCESYGKSCQQVASGSYACRDCNSVGRTCCTENFTKQYCTGFLDCVSGKCAEPVVQPCPVNASSSDSPAHERLILVDLGIDTSQVEYLDDLHIDLDAYLDVDGYMYIEHGESRLATLGHTCGQGYDCGPTGLKSNGQELTGEGSIVSVTVDTDGSGDWDVTISCPS